VEAEDLLLHCHGVITWAVHACDCHSSTPVAQFVGWPRRQWIWTARRQHVTFPCLVKRSQATLLCTYTAYLALQFHRFHLDLHRAVIFSVPEV